jgi:hypothetical protein
MNKYLTNDEVAIDLELTGASIGVASNYQFNLSIPKAIYTTAETPLGNDYNLLTVEFSGMYDTATSSLVSGYMVNLLPNYT